VISRILPTLVLALAAGGAVAQAPEEAPGGKERSARDEAFKMVDAYLVSNLQESLGLDDAQFAKAIPVVKRLQGERRRYFLERTRTVREMRRLLHQGGASESEVLELLKQLKALDVDGPAQSRRNLEALDALLTPMQQAKFRVLEVEVEQRMRELMNRARPRPGGPQEQRD
jgi:Spy/CpxP family protein refolding chaperone